MSSLISDSALIEMLCEGPFLVSTFSSATGDSCVEVAPAGSHGVLLRNSNRRSDGALLVDAEAFGRLLEDIKAGQLDDL